MSSQRTKTSLLATDSISRQRTKASLLATETSTCNIKADLRTAYSPKPSAAARAWSEALGTFLLSTSITCISVQSAPLGSLAINVGVLVGLIYAFSPVSGAIWNPAVAFAFCLRGRMDCREAIIFSAMESAGATVGGIVGRFLCGNSFVPCVATNTVLGWKQGICAEVLFTFTIVTVVLHMATTRANENNSMAGLSIGLTVFACAVAAGPISGAVFNPAIGIGLWLAKALTSPTSLLQVARHMALYTIAPIVGALLGTAAFKAILPFEP